MDVDPIKVTIEFYIVVPIQPWVQRKMRQMRDWKSIGGGVEVGVCDYVFTKVTTLRMVVVRQKVKSKKTPRKQLELVDIENVECDYQVIMTNSDRESEEVWKWYN